MINLGSTDFYFPVHSLPRDKFQRFSSRIFDEWERTVAESLRLPDYSLTLEAEEGSVKLLGTVAAVLGAVYIGIGQYGSFINGVRTIRQQVSDVGDFLAEHAQRRLASPSGQIKPLVCKHGGDLARLQRLFSKVERRELTVDQAMQEATALLGDDTAAAPEFMNTLHESLLKTPLLPEQLILPTIDVDEDPLLQSSTEERVPPPSRPRPTGVPQLQLRVEIWRESKSGKRNVRVTKL